MKDTSACPSGQVRTLPPFFPALKEIQKRKDLTRSAKDVYQYLRYVWEVNGQKPFRVCRSKIKDNACCSLTSVDTALWQLRGKPPKTGKNGRPCASEIGTPEFPPLITIISTGRSSYFQILPLIEECPPGQTEEETCPPGQTEISSRANQAETTPSESSFSKCETPKLSNRKPETEVTTIESSSTEKDECNDRVVESVDNSSCPHSGSIWDEFPHKGDWKNLSTGSQKRVTDKFLLWGFGIDQKTGKPNKYADPKYTVDSFGASQVLKQIDEVEDALNDEDPKAWKPNNPASVIMSQLKKGLLEDTTELSAETLQAA